MSSCGLEVSLSIYIIIIHAQLSIRKNTTKSAAFCIRFQFFTYMSGFYNVVQIGYR